MNGKENNIGHGQSMERISGKYRIKKVTRGNETAYYPQYRFMFVWCHYDFWDITGAVFYYSFDSYDDAVKFILDKAEKPKVKYFNI